MGVDPIELLKSGAPQTKVAPIKRGSTVNLGDAHDPFPMAPREQMPWDPGWKPTKAADLPRPVLRGGVVANVSPGSPPPANDRFEKVPELGEVRLAAGEGIENDHEQETGYIQFRRSFLRAVGADGGRARVVYAKGDSMLPVIQDGAALLVVPDESLTLRDLGAGGVFAINYDGKMIVKSIVMDPRSGRWMARSFNELHPDIPLDDDSKVKVLGRVVWVGARLPEGDAGQWVRR
ncbi:putative phage repressor protein [plant metagenome]|uniref:Putative phage repressor protein n=2 Tax=plant metagenome TaxID=1297885 RepID=A0A484Q6L8_9ZZZZ